MFDQARARRRRQEGTQSSQPAEAALCRCRCLLDSKGMEDRPVQLLGSSQILRLHFPSHADRSKRWFGTCRNARRLRPRWGRSGCLRRSPGAGSMRSKDIVRAIIRQVLGQRVGLLWRQVVNMRMPKQLTPKRTRETTYGYFCGGSTSMPPTMRLCSSA